MSYLREIQIPKLIGLKALPTADLLKLEVEDAFRIVLATRRTLRFRLRIMRRAGQQGHWSYSYSAHVALQDAIRGETEIARMLVAQFRSRVEMRRAA